MRGRLRVLGAVVLALLLIGGVGAITSVTVSEFTSDEDFEQDSVETLNLTVNGSGDGATLDAQAWDEGVNKTIGSSSGSFDNNLRKGLVFSPTERITGVVLTMDSNSGGDTLWVVNHDTGQTIDTYSTSQTPIRIEEIFDPDTEYRLVFGNSDGTNFNANERTQAPVSGDGFNVTHGYDDGEDSSIYSIATMQVLRGGETATYRAIHDEAGAQTGVIDVAEITNATATAQYQVPDGSGGWSTIDTATISSAGETTTSLSDTTGGQYRVVVEAENGGAYQEDWTFNLDSDRLEGERTSPEVTAESPSDGERVTSSSVELAANVSDVDFSESWGDNVTVRIYGNGDEIHNETVTSDQQVTYQWSDIELGENEWYVEVEDNYGLTDQTQTRTFNTPAEIRIYNESSPEDLVSSSVDVQVTFFGDSGGVYNRTATDGTVNLEGLPADERFVVDIDPDNEYHQRTVIIESIFSQQNVYVLPTSATSVDTRFVLDDPTGQFDSETTLYIEKPINRNGSISYETLHADQFGSEGVQATLEQGVRYHLRLESQNGVSQDIGPYRAAETETVNVRPGSPTIDLETHEDGWASGAGIIQPREGDYRIEYAFDDPQMNTSQLEVSVYEQNNQSNQLGATRTHTDLGSVSGTFNLTENQTATVWVIEFDVSRGGEQFTTTETVAVRESLTGELSDFWRFVIGIGILFVSAGVFSYLNAGVGGVVVAIEGGVLWYTGWLTGATTAAGIVMALFIAIIMHIYRSSGP